MTTRYVIWFVLPLISLLAIAWFSWQKMAILSSGHARYDDKSWKLEAEIGGPRTVGQTFTADHNSLFRIDVLMATYNRINTHDVIFHLKTDRQARYDLKTVVIDAKKVQDVKLRSFTFSPIHDSKGKSYFFYIESPDSTPGNAVNVWSWSRDIFPRGVKYINGQPSTGDIIFISYYRPSRSEVLAVFFHQLTNNKPLIWGNIGFYIAIEVAYVALFDAFLLYILKTASSKNEWD